MRLSKDVGNTHYSYLYQNGLLVQETIGDKVLDYSYTSGGQIVSVRYKTNAKDSGVYYYYALNSRGDVVGLYDENGALYAKYTYDVWGNPISVKNASGANLPSDDIANIQSMRYRGYYYDSDTGFYYLQSRYYDPVTHRFINEDSITDNNAGMLGYNLYLYSANNPVNVSDPSGHWIIKDALRWIKNKVKKIVNRYIKPAIKYVAKRVVRPVVKFVKKAVSKFRSTTTCGVSGRAAFGLVLSGSAGLSFDSSGNIAYTISGSTGGGTPGASASGFISLANASDVEELNGGFVQIGGSGGEGGSIGVDWSLFKGAVTNSNYTAITVSGGVGVNAVLAEVHGEVGYTKVYHIINIFDVAENAYNSIMEW